MTSNLTSSAVAPLPFPFPFPSAAAAADEPAPSGVFAMRSRMDSIDNRDFKFRPRPPRSFRFRSAFGSTAKIIMSESSATCHVSASANSKGGVPPHPAAEPGESGGAGIVSPLGSSPTTIDSELIERRLLILALIELLRFLTWTFASVIFLSTWCLSFFNARTDLCFFKPRTNSMLPRFDLR